MLRPAQLFCALLATILLLATPAALAQGSGSQHQLTTMEYNVLSRAQHFLKEKKDQTARQTLRSFLPVVKFRPYPKALALNMLASTYLTAGEYTKALPLLEQAVVTHALPHDQQRNAEYNLAVAYAQTKESAKAAALLKKLIPQYKHPSTDQLMLAATTNFQAKHMAAAQKYALATLKVKGAHPSKIPYQILLSLQFKAKNYLAALKTTHTMMKLWPDDNSLVAPLANLQLMVKQYPQALETYRKGLASGVITGEASFENYAKLLIMYGNPKVGLRTLNKYIREHRIPDSQENKLLRINAWTKIKGAAPADMLSAVVAASPGAHNGQRYLYAASLCQRLKNWKCAVQYTHDAIAKGGLGTEAGDAYLLLGSALYKLGKNQNALAAFVKASGYKSVKKPAGQYIKYLRYELQFSQPPSPPPKPAMHHSKAKVSEASTHLAPAPRTHSTSKP